MSEIESNRLQQKRPWLEPWPALELQRVLQCPACESQERTILHEGLVDNVFFVAPGRWRLYECMCCNSSYLDPRPNEASIGKAYDNYYTHTTAGSARMATEALGRLRRVRRAVANGYLNRRYGTERTPASKVGGYVLGALPVVRQWLDAEFRYLPKPIPGQTLLDVGCGNGGFLASAAEAGWEVMGVDPDPKAVATAKQSGLDARLGSIAAFDDLAACFDALTLSHVIEHVHEPRDVIRAAYRLLKPGGVLYIDTPNIQSYGAKRFGRNWRGLEPPRHLVLLSVDGLFRLLRESGFERLGFKQRGEVRTGIDLSSLRMRKDLSPYDDTLAVLPLTRRIGGRIPRSVSKDEFLTVLAWKPKI